MSPMGTPLLRSPWENYIEKTTNRELEHLRHHEGTVIREMKSKHYEQSNVDRESTTRGYEEND